MQIKDKHLQRSERAAIAKRRRERLAREAEAARKRIQRPSEFITHVRILDQVHDAYRGKYCVAVRGSRLTHLKEIATAHFVAPRS